VCGEFLLDPAALVAAGAGKVLLRVGQLIRIQAKLRLGDVQIVRV
jgi:hypothetical protein